MANPAPQNSIVPSLIAHIGLPPHIPAQQEDSTETSRLEQGMIDILRKASVLLRESVDGSLVDDYDQIDQILQKCNSIHNGGILEKTSMVGEFQSLEDVPLLIHVTEQNAGLFLRRDTGPDGPVVVFEAFELSVTSDKVLEAKAGLQMDFPGWAVAVPLERFQSPSFEPALADFLERASSENIKHFAPHVKKGDSMAVETRDTMNPYLITRMLMSLLEACGQRLSSTPLRKRVFDDIRWSPGAERPWRRSPFWLLLRVGIQRHFCLAHGGEYGTARYKVLMAVVLKLLLDDAVQQRVAPELASYLKAKLARRLAKLETSTRAASSRMRKFYSLVLGALHGSFLSSLGGVDRHINNSWDVFKQGAKRIIPPLQRYCDERGLQLTLPNSRTFLRRILNDYQHQVSNQAQGEGDRSLGELTVPKTRALEFCDKYYAIFAKEQELHGLLNKAATSSGDDVDICNELAAAVSNYVSLVGKSLNGDPQQKSQMLLLIMEMWTALDEIAVNRFGLLSEYSPAIPSGIMEVLQLESRDQMDRLHRVEDHLRSRYSKCAASRMTIFHEPIDGCFAQRFYDSSADMQRLHRKIEIEAGQARQKKLQELQQKSAKYEQVTRRINSLECTFITDEMEIVVHDDKRCTKCYLTREKKRIKIDIHEHPLPASDLFAKVAVFELICSPVFSTYRDTTWLILNVLANPRPVTSPEPPLQFAAYKPLEGHWDWRPLRVCLASSAKSHLGSHYRIIDLPVPLDKVLRVNALRLGYYDCSTKTWVAKQSQNWTFVHHCRLTALNKSPFAAVEPSDQLLVNFNRPTSYEVLASQPRCPPGLNLHEFVSYQNLLSGTRRRWPLILAELGSSNLNFGVEAVSQLICQIALQAGPADETSAFRVIHSSFQDVSFCQRLMEQIDLRLDSIAGNWREFNCMDMLITLILRCCSFAVREPSPKYYRLLQKARDVTFRWTKQLRDEVLKSADINTSRTCSRYALWAALLCKRTYSLGATSFRYKAEKPRILALSCFIQCSVILKDNIDGDPAKLDPILKHALVRDLRLSYSIHDHVNALVKLNPLCIEAVVNEILPSNTVGSSERRLAQFRFWEPTIFTTFGHWAEVKTESTLDKRSQLVHIGLLEGYFMVDHQTVGKLPAEHRDSEALKHLFDDQNLTIYPSHMRGMSYVVAYPIRNHEIHLDCSGSGTVVKAQVGDRMLQLIQPDRFRSEHSFDLPASLIDDRVHWLDLRSGVLEIRSKTRRWESLPSNWLLNVRTQRAFQSSRRLVDPGSRLFNSLAQIFHGFEQACHLTVFQIRNKVYVDLKRLDLSFYINQFSNLECRQLHSIIDRDQDAGTLYGLKSGIVIRDAKNPTLRSIIVPMGTLTWQRHHVHVEVLVQNDGRYCRYHINTTLGRLECPAEPTLLYLKALLHAYTSFVAPDTLTGRTGTEEALHCLRSGYCQPWQPLTEGPLIRLEQIAHLSPKRFFYPPCFKHNQEIKWDDNLTISMQSDEFRPVVEAILAKSSCLAVFAPGTDDTPNIELAHDSSELRARAICRNRRYQRPVSATEHLPQPSDVVYKSRDGCVDIPERRNVFEVASILLDRPARLKLATKLAQILEKWERIGGFENTFSNPVLSDLLDVQMPVELGSLVNLCRSTDEFEVYPLMFTMGMIAFNPKVDMTMVRTLLAFAIFSPLKEINPPGYPVYHNFRFEAVMTVESLIRLIKPYIRPCPDPDPAFLNVGRAERQRLENARLAYLQLAERDCEALALHLVRQWPNANPSSKRSGNLDHIDVKRAMEIITPEWQRLQQNWILSKYLKKVQLALKQRETPDIGRQPPAAIEDTASMNTLRRPYFLPTLSNDLLKKSGPAIHHGLAPSTVSRAASFVAGQPRHGGSGQTTMLFTPASVAPAARLRMTSAPLMQESGNEKSKEADELQSLVQKFIDSQSTVRVEYGQDLMESLNAFRKVAHQSPVYKTAHILDSNRKAIGEEKRRIRAQMNSLFQALTKDEPQAEWLTAGGLWPCISVVTVMENLRTISPINFGPQMKRALVELGLTITSLQRCVRIDDALRKSNQQTVQQELRNLGHGNWNPEEKTDWLLLEIDADIMIRDEQVDVANATISPQSGSNAVLQMNMGQGKTSCIMPMAALLLADGKNLMRVIVPKALLLQTTQTMQSRVGGLAGRQLIHVPFSRKTSTSVQTIQAFLDLHSRARASSSVVVALPEHILSFMLSGIQRVSDKQLKEAGEMIRAQEWLREKSRDVLDECDFTLAVKTQLIYPSGARTTVDGHPHRWEMIENLLQLADRHIYGLEQQFNESIEVSRRPEGGYPLTFFLRKDVEDALIDRLVEDVIQGHLHLVPCQTLSLADLDAVRQFISASRIEPAIVDRVITLFADNSVHLQMVYLLRGLLVHRILLLTLKKRWNVQYGLHANREPIAVPYHAKGVPSDQAEWGHPDVAILFTCLSLYHKGLDQAQLRQCLEHVVKIDDPASEYERWTLHVETMPDSLKEWSIINVDDKIQLAEILRHIRFEIIVIDYFLNHFVFPRHARQFEIKLQASGWDLPLWSTAAKHPGKQQGRTTGFSGTNDNRTMLPLTIQQRDLPGLMHTNAEVLTYLLQPRNRECIVAADSNGKRVSEVGLLQMLCQRRIRMLIDAGAQILEMDNLALVTEWLKIDENAPGALYFDEKNKPWILLKNRTKLPLLASPFAEDIGDCLVYLDDAHTRGTDLKMPENAVGALTLGLGQTKDSTVQAAMRLRQLATTQKIVFFAPPEVNQSILDLCKGGRNESINSADVIEWLLEQSCNGLEQLQPLYFSHGIDFCNRTKAALQNPAFLEKKSQRTRYLEAVRQIEHQTLDQQYAPKTHSASAVRELTYPWQLSPFVKKLHDLRRAFRDVGDAVHASALQEIEQEKEVAYEVEAVREVQKPTIYSPLSFSGLHPAIIRFTQLGDLVNHDGGVEHAFQQLADTALGKKFGIKPTSSKLYASTELRRSVAFPRNSPDDDYLRPVNWILWSMKSQTAVIITPEEAELVILLLQSQENPVTHLLTYSAPVTRRMLHFDDLRYYAIPPLPENWKSPMWLRVELGICAARLYFTYDEYPAIQSYLGCEWSRPSSGASDLLLSFDELSIQPANTSPPRVPTTTSFCAKPLSFLLEYLAVKRKGQDFTHTPMGYVCQGKQLTAEHPFFSPERTAAARPGQITFGGAYAAREDGEGEVAESWEGDGDSYEELEDLEAEVKDEGEEIGQLDRAAEEEL